MPKDAHSVLIYSWDGWRRVEMGNVCGKSQRGGFVNGTEHIQMFLVKFYKDVSPDLIVNLLWGYVQKCLNSLFTPYYLISHNQ